MRGRIGRSIDRLALATMWAQIGVLAVYVGTYLSRFIGLYDVFPYALIVAVQIGALIAAGVGIVAVVIGRRPDGGRSVAGWMNLVVAGASFVFVRFLFVVVGV